MRFAEKRAERPLASPRPRRRFRGNAWRGGCSLPSEEDSLDQAKQNTQGYPRSQVGKRALLQQCLRGRQVVVSVPLWAQRQAIQQRCEVLFEQVCCSDSRCRNQWKVLPFE